MDWLLNPLSVRFPRLSSHLIILILFAGAVSDSSASKYRRRFWIVLSTVALVIATVTLAYCQVLAAAFVDIIGIGAGDWDEERNKRVSTSAWPFRCGVHVLMPTFPIRYPALPSDLLLFLFMFSTLL